MPIDVSLLTDQRYAPKLVERDRQLTGRRIFLVRTVDEAEALRAPGVPQYGDAWSTAIPTLQVSGLETEYMGGTDADATRTGGVTHVTVDYTGPNGRGRLPAPAAGLKYTDYQVQTDTIQIFFPDPLAGFVGPPSPFPIANGQGAPKKVPTMRISVHRFYGASEGFDLSAWIAVMGNVNNAPVVLPPLYGRADAVWTLARGQMLYNGPRPSVVTGSASDPGGASLIEVVHDFDVALDFLFRWRYEDKDGLAIGDVVETQIYRGASFPAF